MNNDIDKKKPRISAFDIKPQIREQMSVPDLYVLTVAFLALKKTGFSKIKNFSKIFFEKF